MICPTVIDVENDGETRHTEPGTVSYRVLSIRMIWYASAVIVVLGVAVAVWLLTAFGRGDAKELPCRGVSLELRRSINVFPPGHHAS